MPALTIGIPTYNRAKVLPRAIEAALSQTAPDVEVIVSDNASTDETPKVVRSYGDRVRYHKNERNIGPGKNFALLTELATAPLFAWLQDDDVIHMEFATRAIAAFRRFGRAAIYSAYAPNTHSDKAFWNPPLIGPPFPVDWMRSEVGEFDGSLVAVMSLFLSVTIPPVQVFRTHVLRRAVRSALADSECILLNERIIVAEAAREGSIAVDPWVGGVFTRHEGQACHVLQMQDAGAYGRQWLAMARVIGDLLRHWPEDWRPGYSQFLDSVDVHDRLSWVNGLRGAKPETWRQAHPVAAEARNLMITSIPPEFQGRVNRIEDSSGLARRVIRRVTPPIVWDALRSLRRRGLSTVQVGA